LNNKYGSVGCASAIQYDVFFSVVSVVSFCSCSVWVWFRTEFNIMALWLWEMETWHKNQRNIC